MTYLDFAQSTILISASKWVELARQRMYQTQPEQWHTLFSSLLTLSNPFVAVKPSLAFYNVKYIVHCQLPKTIKLTLWTPRDFWEPVRGICLWPARFLRSNFKIKRSSIWHVNVIATFGIVWSLAKTESQKAAGQTIWGTWFTFRTIYSVLKSRLRRNKTVWLW